MTAGWRSNFPSVRVVILLFLIAYDYVMPPARSNAIFSFFSFSAIGLIRARSVTADATPGLASRLTLEPRLVA